VAEPGAVPASIDQTMRRTCDQVTDFERALAPVADLVGVIAPIGHVVGHVPQVGGQASALLGLAQAGRDVTVGLQLACEATEPVLQRTLVADRSGRIGSALEELATQRGRLGEASARLRSAEERLAGIDEHALDPQSRRLLVELRGRLPMAIPRLALLAELPAMFGYDGPRRYLILGQNSDELRPTGGFIGTSGVVTFDHGRVVQQRYGSSFDFNVPFDRVVPPPTPLTRFMGAGYWHLREANWAPDFPSTAQQAQYFFRLHSDEPLEGVIALDQDFVAQLLTVVGSISIPGFDEVVTAENVRERLDYQVHVVSGDTEALRKAVVSALFPLLAERLSTLPRERLGDLVVAMNRALAEQDLLIWVDDPAAQQALAALAWDGHLLAAPSDYVFLVNANLGANKINREVEQELDYEVHVDADGRLIGRASVRFQNRHATTDPGPYKTADYRNFMRLVVPAGSELVSGDGFDSNFESTIECQHTTLSGLVVVPPGEERRVELTYRLPATVGAASYSLVIQKQPGSGAFPVRVRYADATASEVSLGLWTHHTVTPTEGGLVAARWVQAGPEPVASACAIHTEPPRMLARPASIAIPRLDVDGAVEPLGVQLDGVLEAPSRGDQVGWYGVSARPGQVGNMVMSGHLDLHKRPAIFWRLHELRAGDQIEVLGEDGARHAYQVSWARDVDATSAPLDDILGPTTERWLTLITCGGPFDPHTGEYRSRTIVRAKLAEPDPG
jgi:sortase (surface protein transpeptidase)